MPDTTEKKYYSYHITQRFLMAMDRILGNRQNGKLTANAFGETVGMSASNINRLRNSAGENTVTLEAIARLCEVYKISPYWLLTGKGEMYTNAELFAAYESLEERVGDIEDAMVGIETTLKTIKMTLPAGNKNGNKISGKTTKNDKN